MSFSAEVKDEMCRVVPGCTLCERSTLSALVRIDGTLSFSGKGQISLQIDTDIISVGRLIIRLLHELYHLDTSYSVRQSVLHKNSNYLIEVPYQPGLETALKDLGILTAEGGLELGISAPLVEKTCCAGAYLRGLFLGSGFVSNPRGDFHFEIIVEHREMADALVAILEEKDIHAKIMPRRNAFMVYLKSGEAISDFLAFAGAHQATLYMEDQRVYKSIRNEVNRKTNAEIANQEKASNAAVDQVFAIKKVADAYGIENLPTALQEYIRLRVSYPEATLQELGERAVPPLSKSAIYHRVRRIEQMAKDIKQ